jgi:hypothetical protein
MLPSSPALGWWDDSIFSDSITLKYKTLDTNVYMSVDQTAPHRGREGSVESESTGETGALIQEMARFPLPCAEVVFPG